MLCPCPIKRYGFPPAGPPKACWANAARPAPFRAATVRERSSRDTILYFRNGVLRNDARITSHLAAADVAHWAPSGHWRAALALMPTHGAGWGQRRREGCAAPPRPSAKLFLRRPLVNAAITAPTGSLGAAFPGRRHDAMDVPPHQDGHVSGQADMGRVSRPLVLQSRWTVGRSEQGNGARYRSGPGSQGGARRPRSAISRLRSTTPRGCRAATVEVAPRGRMPVRRLHKLRGGPLADLLVRAALPRPALRRRTAAARQCYSVPEPYNAAVTGRAVRPI